MTPLGGAATKPAVAGRNVARTLQGDDTAAGFRLSGDAAVAGPGAWGADQGAAEPDVLGAGELLNLTPLEPNGEDVQRFLQSVVDETLPRPMPLEPIEEPIEEQGICYQ